MKKKLVSWVLSSAMTLNFAATMPINAFAASGDSRVYEKDGYTVTYSVGSEWDNNQTIEVTIQNTGEESILNWALKYDIDGALSNVWNSKVFCSSEEYTVIKNTGYNYEIEPGQAIKYGYILTSDTDAPAELPEDIELFNRRIDVKSGYETDFNITSDWYTGFQAEISITNTSDEPIGAWTLSFNGNFDINNIWNAKLISSENRNYVTANQLWTTPINPGESTSFGFTADKSATENAAAENFALTAVVIGESSLENAPEEDEPEDIDYELDTDEDGLPDYYEEILGTDKNKADTDSDGLNDGYEVFYLGTNPTKADSDDNGIPDGSEDPDNDGLTNIKECELGTDPNNADTDGDGLSDGAEVYTYGTDPLKYDTDDDGISDGDEITLGLDPKNGSTNGTPDSKKTFTQIVSSDSEVLSAINENEETPFKVSLEMKAAGVAENNIYARESGYSNAIENSAIIGVAPEFVYTDGLAVEEVTVKFELDNSIVSNTLGTYAAENDGFKDIKRLMVFMFFDDVNMLLPVETNYDEVNNVVYATTDRVGTYCLMDMELFFQNLSIEPDNSVDKIKLMSYNGNSDTVDAGYNDNFDVAFIVSEVGYDQSQIEGICNEIYAICREIFERSKDVTVSVYGLNGSGNTQSEWYGRADNLENVEILLNHLEPKKIQNKNKVVTVSDCIDYVTLAHKNSDSDETRNRAEYGFLFFDPLYQELDGISAFEYVGKSSRGGDYGMAVLEAINREGTDIAFSTVTSYYQTIEERRSSYVKLLSYKTGGMNIDGISFENVVQKSIEQIYGEVYTPTYKYSMGVLATNWKEVELKAPITYKYYDLSTRDDLTINDIEMYDCVDTDDDGLYDFQEIMFTYNGRDTIIFESTEDDAEISKLYSLSDMIGTDSIYKMPVYVENALLGMDEYSSEYREFVTTPLIFIYSDPTSGDGDGDGISDPEDIMPLVTLNYKATKFSEFVDTAEFFEIKFILECRLMKGYTADECVDCIEILRKYKDTNDIEAFQQEIISAGLVSPDAAAPATWFDKLFWGAWAENRSAPLLNEYENYANETSFEEIFEQSAEQWSESCKIAMSYWVFGALSEHMYRMSKWDYSPYYKTGLIEEQTKIIEDYQKQLENYREYKEFEDIKSKWGTTKSGSNQGVEHFWGKSTNRIQKIAEELGVDESKFAKNYEGFKNFTYEAEKVVEYGIKNQVSPNKTYYFVYAQNSSKNGVVVIVYDGKIQSMMSSTYNWFIKRTK